MGERQVACVYNKYGCEEQKKPYIPFADQAAVAHQQKGNNGRQVIDDCHTRRLIPDRTAAGQGKEQTYQNQQYAGCFLQEGSPFAEWRCFGASHTFPHTFLKNGRVSHIFICCGVGTFLKKKLKIRIVEVFPENIILLLLYHKLQLNSIDEMAETAGRNVPPEKERRVL